eukprot:scaffold24320_cov56-Phaeocystis_antarctica.AAC.1
MRTTFSLPVHLIRSRPPESFLSRHTLPKKLAVWRFRHVPQDGGWRRRRRRLGRGGLADALLGRGARASAAATKDVEGGGRVEVEHAAWRSVWVCARCEVVRGLVVQVERRGGGLALACGRDEAAAAGAALDHVVAPGNLDVTGRHRRRRRRWRRRWRRILRADFPPGVGNTAIREPREGGAAQ